MWIRSVEVFKTECGHINPTNLVYVALYSEYIFNIQVYSNYIPLFFFEFIDENFSPWTSVCSYLTKAHKLKLFITSLSKYKNCKINIEVLAQNEIKQAIF